MYSTRIRVLMSMAFRWSALHLKENDFCWRVRNNKMWLNLNFNWFDFQSGKILQVVHTSNDKLMTKCMMSEGSRGMTGFISWRQKLGLQIRPLVCTDFYKTTWQTCRNIFGGDKKSSFLLAVHHFNVISNARNFGVRIFCLEMMSQQNMRLFFFETLIFLPATK